MAEEQPECPEIKPAGILEDEKGNGSSNRLIKVMWFAGLIVILGIVAWKSNPPAIPDVPWGIVMITAIVVGGGLGGKFLELSGSGGLQSFFLPKGK